MSQVFRLPAVVVTGECVPRCGMGLGQAAEQYLCLLRNRKGLEVFICRDSHRPIIFRGSMQLVYEIYRNTVRHVAHPNVVLFEVRVGTLILDSLWLTNAHGPFVDTVRG